MFVGQPIVTVSVSVLVLTVKLVSLFALPIRRCPSVTPPAIRMSTACAKTSTGTIVGDIVVPLRRDVGNMRGVVCVASATAGTNSTAVRMCFGRKAGPSVTTIGMRGHMAGTRNLLPTRMAHVNIDARGQRADFLRVSTLIDASKQFSGAFLKGCLSVGIVPHVGHVRNMNSMVRLNSACDVHV